MIKLALATVSLVLSCIPSPTARAAAASKTASVTISLTAVPTTSLPRLQPTLRVVVTNETPDIVPLPSRVALLVKPTGRDPFWAYAGIRGDDVVTGFNPALTTPLAAHEKRDVSFWSSPDEPVWFVVDPRLWAAGSYRMQLVAADNLDPAALTPTSTEFGTAVVSNATTFTVETPKGDDAAVWNLVRAARRTAWPDELAGQIWADYPNSVYAAFAVPVVPNDVIATNRNLRSAIEKWPNLPITAWRRLLLAFNLTNRAHSAMQAADVDAAADLFREARKSLEEAIKGTLDPVLRGRAQEMLDRDILTKEEIIRELTPRAGSSDGLAPYALCTATTADSKLSVWFGIDNPSTQAITVDIGEDNKFTPAPFDRGQPTRFPAGVNDRAFAVLTDEPSLTWHLQKNNLHVEIRQLPDCSAEKPF